ncbi:hypothetical protein NVP1124O_23 [Vibrio phage 1.124.O._10N.286.49.B1]|nr:hypothetical protein NVP1124O_23 [Vibrio phage 1.124.O._10N.286.49.B1]
MKQTITGTISKEAGFSVSFPNGFDGEPDIKITGLKVDCDGDSGVYGVLSACANWINSHVEEMKSKPQVIYKTADFTDANGIAKSVRLAGGKVIKED